MNPKHLPEAAFPHILTFMDQCDFVIFFEKRFGAPSTHKTHCRDEIFTKAKNPQFLSSFSVLSNPHGGGGGHSDNETHTDYDICGANFCVVNSNNNQNLQRPADSEIFEISGIYLACIFAAVAIIAIFVDPLTR